MPATWSKYDSQPLPNPKDAHGEGGGDVPGTSPSKSLRMNWTTPRTPTAPPPRGAGGSADSSGSADIDGDGTFQNPIGGAGAGGSAQPDFDRLEVATDDLSAYEQNILTAAADLVSRFNALRDRSQNVLDEPIWGHGEGDYFRPRPNHQNIDNVDLVPQFQPSNSAVAARDFTRSIGPAQQNALGGVANMITISGMFIEVLDATVSSYAQMDMMAVFPEPQELKTTPDA